MRWCPHHHCVLASTMTMFFGRCLFVDLSFRLSYLKVVWNSGFSVRWMYISNVASLTTCFQTKQSCCAENAPSNRHIRDHHQRIIWCEIVVVVVGCCILNMCSVFRNAAGHVYVFIMRATPRNNDDPEGIFSAASRFLDEFMYSILYGFVCVGLALE